MGLREQKKARARQALIENAIALFRERGFEDVKVRDVCARCELSEATFFNYFASKDGVLNAWAHARVGAAFEAAAQSDRPLRPAVRAAVRQLAQELEDDRELAAMAWSRARTGPPDEARAARALVEAGQQDGQLRADLDPDELATLLHTSLAGAVAAALTAGSPLAPRLGRAADLVLDGARKRNERVRMGAAGSPRPPA